MGVTPRFISGTPAPKSNSEVSVSDINQKQEANSCKSMADQKKSSDKLTDVVPSVRDISEAESNKPDLVYKEETQSKKIPQ